MFVDEIDSPDSVEPEIKSPEVLEAPKKRGRGRPKGSLGKKKRLLIAGDTREE